MMKKHTIVWHSALFTLLAFSLRPAIANAQNATPWWQKLVKSAAHKAEQKVANAARGAVDPPANTNGSTNNPSKNEQNLKASKTQTNPNAQVALKGASYKYYKYTFSGDLKLRLSGFKNKSYTGWVISAGPPDYKIKSFNLNIGGLTTGWKLSKATTSSYWAWDRPEGSLRVHLTVAAPGDKLPSGGEATINIFGTFIGNYTFSTTNSMTRTPVGPPLLADKNTSGNPSPTSRRQDSTTSGNSPGSSPPGMKSSIAADKMTLQNGKWTAELRRSASPIRTKYSRVSPDILGLRPGMGVKAVEDAMAHNYKMKPMPSSAKAYFSYRTITMWSRPFIAELSDQNGQNDHIRVYFGTQATGNTVVGIKRVVKFRDSLTAPTMKGIVSDLDRKYGPPTTPPGNLRGAPWIEMNWVFGTHGLRKKPCPGNSCPCISNIRNISNDVGIGFLGGISMASYLQLDQSYAPVTPWSQGEYECVYAFAEGAYHDTSRVSQLEVVINDPADQMLMLKQTRKQLYPTAVAAYNKVAKPQKEPKL